MMGMTNMNTTDELYHHGVLGQRWGVRRYQNKDGSLTALGKKRATKLESKYEKVTGKKMGSKSSDSSSDSKTDTSKPKSISEMSNAELQAKIDRIRLETTLDSLTPKHVSAGEKFVNGMKSSATSILKDKGTKIVGDYLDKKIRESIGLTNKDPNAALKKEAETMNYKRQIEMAKQYLESQKSKKTPTKNLLGNIDDLTDQQVKDMITRLDDEEKLRNKLANQSKK